MNALFIKDLSSGQVVDTVFLLREKTMRLTKRDKPYLILNLADKTGSIEGRVWDDAEKINEIASAGDAVKVSGPVEEYRGTKQIKVESLAKAEEGTYDRARLVKVYAGRDEAISSIRKMFKELKNPWLKKLADLFLGDESLMEALREGVGAKRWHNAYIGGLVEHTYEVMHIADQVCSLYPEADREMTIFGAFLHDLGKVRELDPSSMVYTDEGGLVGHIAIGFRILTEKIGLIKDFPKDLSLRLEHIVLSHHGEYEQQSPVLPKTLEATIVYHTDDLVSQANAIREIQLKDRETGRVWSDFVFIKNRKYYVKHVPQEDSSSSSAPGAQNVDPDKTDDNADDLFSEDA